MSCRRILEARAMHREARKRNRKHDWRPTMRARDAILRRMGFESYKCYLASNLWKAIREQQIKKHPECCICGTKAVIVHHINYDEDTMKAWNGYSFASVCEPCHKAIHADAQGKQLSLKMAYRRITELKRERLEIQKVVDNYQPRQKAAPGQLLTLTSRATRSQSPQPQPLKDFVRKTRQSELAMDRTEGGNNSRQRSTNSEALQVNQPVLQ